MYSKRVGGVNSRFCSLHRLHLRLCHWILDPIGDFWIFTTQDSILAFVLYYFHFNPSEISAAATEGRALFFHKLSQPENWALESESRVWESDFKKVKNLNL